MWKLVIEDDEGKRTVVPLTRDDYTIGRQEGNTIRLTERNVSREHGRIKRRKNSSNGGLGTAHSGQAARLGASNGNGAPKDNFVLEDCSSYNGLFVNGLRVASTQHLQHGDLIQIGDYRIVLQDDAASSIESDPIPVTTTEPHDTKATIPMGAALRGQNLTERPSRFVMLVGPTPGVEYPLEGGRMTIGRAEDSSISVNHNSVSRLHCEVHALGDGRYEIVDKGSSNGVRVNAVELKRSIIEAGDLIELGDVRFKFVGAGQVFVAGPNESQQLTAISDRDADLADPRRKSWGGYALPVVGAGLVGALIILAFVYVLRSRATIDAPPGGNIGATNDADEKTLNDARESCTVDDCEAAYAAVSGLPEKSPWRDTKEFKDIESKWAGWMMNKARSEPEPLQKRILLNRVNAARTLDDAHRSRVVSELAALDEPTTNPSQLPFAATPSVTGALPPVPAVPSTPTTTPARPPTHTPVSSVTPVAPTTTSAATTPPMPVVAKNTFERANDAAREGRSSEVRKLLEAKVRAGHGSADEVRLVKAACQSPFDKACIDEIKTRYP